MFSLRNKKNFLQIILNTPLIWSYVFFNISGAKVSDTIRKGIITLDAYPNGTETEFMLGNTAALGGEFRKFVTVVEVYSAQFNIYLSIKPCAGVSGITGVALFIT